jgi:hypothetical protein
MPGIDMLANETLAIIMKYLNSTVPATKLNDLTGNQYYFSKDFSWYSKFNRTDSPWTPARIEEAIRLTFGIIEDGQRNVRVSCKLFLKPCEEYSLRSRIARFNRVMRFREANGHQFAFMLKTETLVLNFSRDTLEQVKPLKMLLPATWDWTHTARREWIGHMMYTAWERNPNRGATPQFDLYDIFDALGIEHTPETLPALKRIILVGMGERLKSGLQIVRCTQTRKEFDLNPQWQLVSTVPKGCIQMIYERLGYPDPREIDKDDHIGKFARNQEACDTLRLNMHMPDVCRIKGIRAVCDQAVLTGLGDFASLVNRFYLLLTRNPRYHIADIPMMWRSVHQVVQEVRQKSATLKLANDNRNSQCTAALVAEWTRSMDCSLPDLD